MTTNAQPTTTKTDVYQKVTDKIISLLEKGVLPWRKTWSSYGLARNYATGHVYSGINLILMNNTEHPIPYFMTFKQVTAKGGNISGCSEGFMQEVWSQSTLILDTSPTRRGKPLQHATYGRSPH